MKVIIVKEGQWGSLEPKDYVWVVKRCKECLERAGGEVLVVETAQDARESLQQDQTFSVVFVSRGAYPAAKSLANDFPKTRIVILSGLLPLGEENQENIIWLTKEGLFTGALVEAVLN